MDVIERLRSGEACKDAGGPDADCSAKNPASGCLCAIAAAKIAELQAALKPLAAIPLWSDDRPDCSNDFISDYNLHLHFTVDQVKAARAASGDK